MEFTPKRLHYFKRELVTEQLKKEMDLLIDLPDIEPILNQQDDGQFPFLRYIFHHIIVEFPLLKHQTSHDDFWPKLKLFFNAFNQAQLPSSYTPRQSESNLQRKLIHHKIQKSLVFAFCASIKTTQGKEESIQVSSEAVSEPTPTSCHINILTVREIKIRKMFSDVSHPEFLIETIDRDETFYVARDHEAFRRLREQLKDVLAVDLPLVPLSHQAGSGPYGEQDRLALKGWLYQVMGGDGRELSKSQARCQRHALVEDFLKKDPIVFSMEEEKDANRRELADREREAQQVRYQEDLSKRVLALNDILETLKQDIIKPGGLIHVFDIIKSTQSIEELPLSLRKAIEWGRINFAFALHKQFISSDLATENVDKLRLTHNLMPYRTLSLFLRFSNPMTIMKSLLDLFLAQPFGGKSLLQRLIISNMNEESKTFEKEIQILKEKINDQSLCDKVYQAVRTPLPEHSDFRKYKSPRHEILALLTQPDIPPLLDHVQDLTAKQLQQLIQLWELYCKQHEQELMMDLVFQGMTAELLKEFIAVFYTPLAQVYQAADISTTIRDVSSFIDDLLALIDRERSVQAFIDLVQRHEQHFYDFVHNVHRQEASRVFDDLIRYIDTLFTFVAEGMPGQLDLNVCIQKAGFESREDLAKLEKEIDALCQYRYQQKLYRFERQKLKIREAEVSNVFDYIPKRTEMINALDDYNDEYDDYESSDDATSHSGSIHSRRSSVSSGSHLSHKGIEEPELVLIPTILPYFIDEVTKMIHSKNE